MSDRRGSVFVDPAPENRAPPTPVPAPVSASEILGANFTLGIQDVAGERDAEANGYYGQIAGHLRNAMPQPYLRSVIHGDRYLLDERNGTQTYNEAQIWSDVEAYRATHPDFLKDIPAKDPVTFHKWLDGERMRRRASAQDVVSRQSGIGQNSLSFGTGVVTSFGDPINDAMMLGTMGTAGVSRTIWQTMGREMLINGATEAAELPLTAANRYTQFGEKMTPGEAVKDIGTAMGAGILLPGTLHVTGKVLSAGAKVALNTNIARGAALAMQPLDKASDVEVARQFSQAVPAEVRTPDQKAALHVIERQADVEATNPFNPTPAGLDAHADKLDGATADILTRGDPNGGAAIRKPVPRRAPATAPVAPEADARTVFMQHVGRAENATGDPNAKNPRSSATGKYQLTDGTWLRYYKREIGAGGQTDAQILAQRSNSGLQDRLMASLTADNAAHLHSIGVPETAGNLYLEHFAGQGGAERILKADPHTPIEGLLSREAIDANPFLKGKTAGDVIDWAHRKMGGRVHDGPVLARENFDTNEEWAAAQREVDMADAAEQAMHTASDRAAAERVATDPGMAPSEPAIRTETEPGAFDLMPPEQPVRAAPTVPAEAPVVAEFTTARGSTYRVEDNGATTRDKAPRSDVGHEGQQGPQPTSEATHYVTHEDSLKLAEFQAQGGPKVAIRQHRDGRIGVKYLEGKDKGKFEKRTMVTPQPGPAIGLLPVETWKSGERVHFGNPITEVRTREPVASAVPLVDHPDIAGPHIAPENAPHAAPIEADRTAPKFDNPTDKAPLAQIESIAHDLRIALATEPDALFRVGDGEVERPLSEILAELDAEDAAIASVKACL